MKVTAFIGSARKKYTYNTTERFLKKLYSLGDVDYELIVLSDYNLLVCKGCKSCLDRGEELCPLKDDRDILIKKIYESDGIVLATPNYSFQVSGLMKIFLDRLGYLFHRPRLFGKAYTSIVAQGVYGAKDIIKYLDFIGKALGFNIVKGCYMTTVEPVSEKRMTQINRIIDRQAVKFYSQLTKKELPAPSLLGLMAFRMARSSMRIMLDEKFRDYTYYREKGWFESDYFYPVKLNPLKKIFGKLFDITGSHMGKNN